MTPVSQDKVDTYKCMVQRHDDLLKNNYSNNCVDLFKIKILNTGRCRLPMHTLPCRIFNPVSHNPLFLQP